MFPKDRRYTTTHEWVRLEDDVAVVGITGYAAEQLGDITYIELPAAEDDLLRVTVLGTIETVKAVVEVISPIDGKVVEVNDAAVDDPDLITEHPYDDGWLVKLSPTNTSQLADLMTAEEYEVSVGAESGKQEEVPKTEEDADEAE